MTTINPKIRLFVEALLQPGITVPLGEEQAHYLLNVMRLTEGAPIAVFNGESGEFLARLSPISRKKAELRVVERRKAPQPVPDIWYVFAPIKHGRIDFIAQKATELGASALVPVITARTIASRVNDSRLLANAIEAAEQCERLDVPQVFDPQPFDRLLAGWPHDRLLLYCDESGGGLPPLALFPTLPAQTAWAVLVGPEGGFTPEEFAALRNQPFAHAISLGPRILRADTAGCAVLSVLMAWRGDWHQQPRFEG